MNFISKMDTSIYYLLLLYALASSISIAVANIAISLASLLAIVRYIKEPITTKLDKGLLGAIGIFLLAVLLSSLFAYKPIDAVNRLWSYIYRILPLILAIFFIRNKEQLIKVLVVMGTSIVVSDGYAIWQGLHGNYRAAAFSSHPMILGGYLVQMIPLLFIVGLEEKNIGTRAKTFFICAGMLSCVALLYNGTRGAWIAIICVFFLYGIFNAKKNIKAVIGILMICLVAGTVTMHVPSLKERVDSLSDKNYQSNTERILLWKSSWNMFIDHPLFGVGAGNFANVYKPKYILPEAKEPELGHAHNNFFQMLAETGIIGLSSFIYMFGYILCSTYRRYRLNHKEVLAIVTFMVTISLLIQGLTEYNFGDSAVIRMYWFILGLTYASRGKLEKL